MRDGDHSWFSSVELCMPEMRSSRSSISLWSGALVERFESREPASSRSSRGPASTRSSREPASSRSSREPAS